MPVNFALPFMHIVSGDYIPYNGRYLKGRPFFQPVASLTVADLYPAGPPPGYGSPTDPISDFFAGGIEFFFDGNSTEASKLYAMFDGFINWTDNRLILTPELKVANELASHSMLEAPIGRIIYDNVDKASVKTALIDLIINSFHSFQAHPILKNGAFIGPAPVLYRTIKQLLDANVLLPDMNVIEPVVDLFLTGKQKLQVLAGDMLGMADFFTATDVLPPAADQPAWFKTINDADRARRILVITKDVGKQVLNPWYYIHQYNSSAKVTPITYRKEFHPALQGIAAPTYGRDALGNTYYFPIEGDLNVLHGFPSNDSDLPDTFTASSANEWRYDDNSLFEAYTPDPATGALTTLFPIPAGKYERNKVASMKVLYSALLNTYCEKMQIPVEVMFGLAGAESFGTTTGDVRLEPLKVINETALSGTTLLHKYNKLIGFHCKAVYVSKENDDFKFVVEPNEGIKGITLKPNLNVDVRMRLYYDRDKSWLIRKQRSKVKNTIEIKATDVYKSGFTGKQPFATELFYRTNKVDVSKASLGDVEFTMPKAGYLQLDMKNTEKLFKKKPTLNGDVTITVYINGTASDLNFVIPQGDQTIKDVSVLETSIALIPGDKIGLGIATDGTAGEIEGLGLKFKLISILVRVPKSENTNPAHPDYADIKNLHCGMAAGGTMAAGSILYHVIGTPGAGVATSKTVATYKAPADGFLLLADLQVTSNSMKSASTIKVLRKKGTGFDPTGISLDVPANTTKITPASGCEKVSKDEEFLLEITTPAAAKPPAPPAPAPAPEQLGGLTMQAYFIPFNDDESFIISRHGYSFDLMKFNRTVKTDPINTENGRTMTWNELDEWIRKTKGGRISVGPFQTLIETAHRAVRSANSLINLMIPFTPPTDLALYLDYLSEPVKALAIAAALIRKQYNFSPDSKYQNQSTQFDMPLVGSVHNAQRDSQGKIISAKGDWGLSFADGPAYIKNSGAMFNQAQKNYRQASFFTPTVQFKK